MGAPPNSPGEAENKKFSAEHLARRHDLRYRFAELLTIEKFEEALSKALVAYRNNEIRLCDLTFVIKIVKTAERMGRLKLSESRIPAYLLPPELAHDLIPLRFTTKPAPGDR